MPPASVNSSAAERVDVVYQTWYKDRGLRLYEVQHKIDRLPRSPFDAVMVLDPNEDKKYPYWI
jgi:hypothetical protein